MRGLAAVEARLETEAVEVAVAVARKLAPELIAREPFAELAALAAGCFRQLVAAPHVVVRVNDALHERAREMLEEIAAPPASTAASSCWPSPTSRPAIAASNGPTAASSAIAPPIEAAIDEAVARYVAAPPRRSRHARNFLES